MYAARHGEQATDSSQLWAFNWSRLRYGARCLRGEGWSQATHFKIQPGVVALALSHSSRHSSTGRDRSQAPDSSITSGGFYSFDGSNYNSEGAGGAGVEALCMIGASWSRATLPVIIGPVPALSSVTSPAAVVCSILAWRGPARGWCPRVLECESRTLLSPTWTWPAVSPSHWSAPQQFLRLIGHC